MRTLTSRQSISTQINLLVLVVLEDNRLFFICDNHYISTVYCINLFSELAYLKEAKEPTKPSSKRKARTSVIKRNA